jgi:hypothetical protein
MTKVLRLSISSCIIFFLLCALVGAQNPPQQPQTIPSSAAALQASNRGDQQNFPPLLLQQLSAIKAAALNDDYAYHQLSHLTENIGPRPMPPPNTLLPNFANSASTFASSP